MQPGPPPRLPVVRLVLTDYPLHADTSAVHVVKATLLDIVRDYCRALPPAPWVSEAKFIEVQVAQAMTGVEVTSA